MHPAEFQNVRFLGGSCLPSCILGTYTQYCMPVTKSIYDTNALFIAWRPLLPDYSRQRRASFSASGLFEDNVRPLGQGKATSLHKFVRISTVYNNNNKYPVGWIYAFPFVHTHSIAYTSPKHTHDARSISSLYLSVAQNAAPSVARVSSGACKDTELDLRGLRRPQLDSLNVSVGNIRASPS